MKTRKFSMYGMASFKKYVIIPKALKCFYLTHWISNVLHNIGSKIEAPVSELIIFTCEHGVRGNLDLISEIPTY